MERLNSIANELSNMEYERGQYFREHDDPQVPGFTIIEAEDGEYRLAERWDRPNGESRWTVYWIDSEQLQSRINDELCEPVGSLTDRQFEQVCQNTDERVLQKSLATA